jgi:flagellar P-ring protein precursor FlgI
MFRRSRFFSLALAGTLLLAGISGEAQARSRIKDIVEFEGVRDNMLVGYGLVVGLNGTGDSLRNAPFTRQSLEAMLERLGVNIRETNLNTKNVAAVMVTARLPPFTTAGAPIDATVSAMGDSKSLLGGTLLVTPLMGAAKAVFMKVSRPPPPMMGTREAGSSMLNLPTETEARGPKAWVMKKEVSWSCPPSRGKASAVFTGTIDPSPRLLASSPQRNSW